MIRRAVRFIERVLLKRGLFLTLTMRYLHRPRRLDLADSPDYVRTCTLELLAEEIYTNNIPGCVAELGVFRGEFARKINAAFPDRKLYLFDTFEGFDERDASADRDKTYSTGSQDFSGTSVEAVLRLMPHRGNCVVRQGRFPETALGLSETFAFVSLDVDLHDPTYEGLRFFYHAIAPGGFIMVHDYGNDSYLGVREAVREFCLEQNVGYFPLCDTCGSAVITRSCT